MPVVEVVSFGYWRRVDHERVGRLLQRTTQPAQHLTQDRREATALVQGRVFETHRMPAGQDPGFERAARGEWRQRHHVRSTQDHAPAIVLLLPDDVAEQAALFRHMVRTRAEKVRRVAQEIPPTSINGPHTGDVLVVGWGGTYGTITAAVEEAQLEGHAVASIHLRHLNPLPPDLGQILRQYRKVLVPEINSGQLVRVLRAEYLVDAVGYNKVRGVPLMTHEIVEAINQLLEAKR